MTKRFYPAVLERGPKGSFAIWFPDFPDCVAGGRTQEDALARSELALAKAVDAIAEADRPLPQPTAFDKIRLPKGCQPIAYFAVTVEPPNPYERVNIYLPKNLILRADKRAEELGPAQESHPAGG
jgi:predicted RNase H-like HicB family nuclease